jgi:hypothetical protein
MFTTPFAFMAAPAGGGFDPDAQAYLDAVVAAGGTVTPTIEEAVNTLFVDLKDEGIYSELKAMYPVVGATAASFAINAIGNTAFNLTFNGTFTFSSSGFNSTSNTSYASTNYVPLTEHPGGTMSLGIFANSNIFPNATDTYMMGTFSAQDRFLGWDYYGGDRASGKYLQNNQTTVAITPGNPFGFAQLSSDGTTKYFSINKNGVEYAVSAAKDGTTLPNLEIYLCNLNVLGAPYTLQQGRACFAYMGNYLTPAKMTAFATIVNAFQTALGRNTY